MRAHALFQKIKIALARGEENLIFRAYLDFAQYLPHITVLVSSIGGIPRKSGYDFGFRFSLAPRYRTGTRGGVPAEAPKVESIILSTIILIIWVQPTMQSVTVLN